MVAARLLHDPRNFSLSNREADIALRFARPEKDYRVLARRLCELPYGVYGPVGPRARALPWITYEESLSAQPPARWLAEALKEDPDARPGLIVNDSDVAVHAIRAGLGRSLLPFCVGDREDGLSRLSGSAPVLMRELWLLVHPDLRDLARIRVVIDWIERVFTEHGIRCGERDKKAQDAPERG